MRGYSDEEVDVFLDEVADEYERLAAENVELQDRVRLLEDQLAAHVQLRDALEKTLVNAQFQADETKANAQAQADETKANASKESELILRDAELKARGIVSDSYTEIQRVQQALVQLKHLEEDFRFKFRSLLEGHLKLLDEAPLNMGAGQAIATEPAPSTEPADEQGLFVVPEPMGEVPEYPPVAQAAVAAEMAAAPEAATGAPETAAAPETATGILAAAAASFSTPVAPDAEALAEPADQGEMPQQVDEAQSVQTAEASAGAVAATGAAMAGSGNTETVEQASIFAEFDKAEAERLAQSGASPVGARGDDPLSGFFFNSAAGEGTEDTLRDGEQGGKSKARDFEW